MKDRKFSKTAYEALAELHAQLPPSWADWAERVRSGAVTAATTTTTETSAPAPAPTVAEPGPTTQPSNGQTVGPPASPSSSLGSGSPEHDMAATSSKVDAVGSVPTPATPPARMTAPARTQRTGNCTSKGAGERRTQSQLMSPLWFKDPQGPLFIEQ